MTLPDRLYMVHDRTEASYDEEYGYELPPVTPDGWEEYSLARFGEVKPFFFPSASKVYRSRSSAEDRAALINRWGGDAIVVESTPEWEALAEAKARRERERLMKRREKHVREAARIQEQIRKVGA